MEFKHIPIMLSEVIDGLDIKPNGIYLDGTIGGAGHSQEILKRLNEDGLLIGVDRDREALNKANEVLSSVGGNFKLVHDNYRNVKAICQNLGIDHLDGILLDIGVSSYQLDNKDRGFSYRMDAKLDMRMDQESGKSAYDIVNTYTKEELEEVIYKYSQERWARRIAEFICEYRAEKPIETTFELTDVIKRAIPKKARENKHPSKKTFQALRIEVNDELGALNAALQDAIDILNPDGRIAVITFHSMEDKIVKDIFKFNTLDCICPPESIICTCNHKRKLKLVNNKPLVASEEELKANPRSESAKLRIAQRV